jgi:small-conductance mechanosensitive channel
MTFLSTIFYGNTLGIWLLAIVIAAVLYLVLRIVKTIVLKRVARLAEKTHTGLDDLVVDVLGSTKGFFLAFLALYAGSLALTLPAGAARVIAAVAVVVLLIQAAIWGSRAIAFGTRHYAKPRIQDDPGSATTFTALAFVARLVLWAVVLLLVLDNLGVDITTLIAGLGIGGIAVALALQNVLGDLFASLSIVLDKPFVLGDFIIVGDYLGTVEHIGLKSTRVRSLSGEQLVFSNNDLLESRIRNYKRMYERRVVFTIGVTYQTPEEELKAIPQMIRTLVDQQKQARFDRAHFKEYGNFSLNFEVVYWVTNPDYNTYMDIHQAINLGIYRAFAEQGIEFAYPTQTVFLEKATVSTAGGDSAAGGLPAGGDPSRG